MEYLSREEIIHDLQQPFNNYIEEYGIDDIGIFEEQGQDDVYYMGYTVKKDGKTYHIHSTFRKEHEGLTPLNNLWTIEPDDPQGRDVTGYRDIDSALREI